MSTATAAERGRLHADDRAVIFANALRADIAGDFPHDNLRLLRERGLIQAQISDADFTLTRAYGLIRDLGELDPALGLVLSFHFSLINDLVAGDEGWSVELRSGVLESVELDGSLIAITATEPELGQPALGGVPKTAVTWTDGASGTLSGHKRYATGAVAVRWLLVAATLDAEAVETGIVLLDREGPALTGLEIVRTWDTLGMRSTRSDDVVFSAVPIRSGQVVKRFARGARTATHQSTTSRPKWAELLLAGVYASQARAALRWYVDFANSRVPTNLGKPLSSLEHIRELIGRLWALEQETDAVLERAVRAFEDDEEPSRIDAAVKLSKIVATRNATAIIEGIAENVGNRGLERGTPFDFYLRNVAHSRAHGATASVLHKEFGAHLSDARKGTQS